MEGLVADHGDEQIPNDALGNTQLVPKLHYRQQLARNHSTGLLSEQRQSLL